MVLRGTGQSHPQPAIVKLTEKAKPQAEQRSGSRGASVRVDEDQGESGCHASQESDSKPAAISLCLYWMELKQGRILTWKIQIRGIGSSMKRQISIKPASGSLLKSDGEQFRAKFGDYMDRTMKIRSIVSHEK